MESTGSQRKTYEQKKEITGKPSMESTGKSTKNIRKNGNNWKTINGINWKVNEKHRNNVS